MSENVWYVKNKDFSFDHMRDQNTVFTISNGYLAIKGNVQAYKYVDYPAAYIAGVWGNCPIFNLESPTKYTRIYHDYEKYDTAKDGISIANLPDPLFFEVFVDNCLLSFKKCTITDFYQRYDLKTGAYVYSYTAQFPNGKTLSVQMCRFADMENIHRAYMRCTVTPINFDGEITVRCGISADTKSNLLSEKQYEVLQTECDKNNVCRVCVQTVPCGHRAEFLTGYKTTLRCKPAAYLEEDRVYNVYTFLGSKGKTAAVETYMVLSSDQDAIYSAQTDAQQELQNALREGFEKAAVRMKHFWKTTWKSYDVKIEGDHTAQLYLRFCLFHLICGAPRHTDKLFMPVKLLTGDHYQGTAFYDTDLYIEPVFLALEPQLCRQLISFRYNILDKSRAIAKDAGYRGAKFAWQVAPWGDEVLGDWWRLQDTNIHLNVDICYSIMQYYYHTDDIEFIAGKAIDIMVEVSRFMASRAQYDRIKDSYSLCGVAGPDESHCNSKDNFYTNYLTRQCFSNTVKLLEAVQSYDPCCHEAVFKRLSLQAEELALWDEMSQKLTLLYYPETGLYEQAEGFFELPLIPKERLKAFAKENKPKAGMWFADLDKYGQTNQPDASAAIWMYPEHFDRKTYRANYRFYDRRNCNFSSMSYVVNSMMAKETGDMAQAYKNFIITAGMDIDASLTGRMDTRAGLHGTAMGGAFMAAVQGFAGVRVTENGLSINPCLPEKWESISFYYCYKGEKMRFIITQDKIIIEPHFKTYAQIPCSIGGKDRVIRCRELFAAEYKPACTADTK